MVEHAVKLALVAIVLTGCAADGIYNDTLPHDTYYTQPPTEKLSLCTSGAYSYFLGDVVEQGTYHLEGQTAVASSPTGHDFTFDLTTRVMATGDHDSPAWTVVTFVGDVDCKYNGL
jgi:hypothetical protein